MGLVMILSASMEIGLRNYGDGWYFFNRQLIAVGMGAFIMMIGVMIPTEQWRRWRPALMWLTLALLVAVLMFGRQVGGSTRWLGVGSLNFQPGELAKLVTIIFMAGYLAKHEELIRDQFNVVVRLAVPFSVIAILLLLEPDFGSLFVIVLMVSLMLFLAGTPLRFFAILMGPLVLLMALIVLWADDRVRRIVAFMNPWHEPTGSGYQLIQSYIALANGGFWGVGLGESIQKLFYLPEAHTDFIFAVFGEEFGFVGVVALVTLYLFITWRIFYTGLVADELGRRFQAYLAYGVASWFMLQALFNMGVNMGLLPTKGLTLPFFSYGGSSMIIFALALAIVFRIDYENRRLQAEGRTG